MKIDKDYKIPKDTRIGHVHLKVADLKRSLDFYCELEDQRRLYVLGQLKPDGVYFISLSSLTESSLVIPTIAKAIAPNWHPNGAA